MQTKCPECPSSGLLVSTLYCGAKSPRTEPALQTSSVFSRKSLQHTALATGYTRLTQPYTLLGTVQWVSALWLSNNTNNDGWMSRLWQPIDWLKGQGGSHLALAYIHSSELNEPCNGFDIDERTIYIVLIIIFIITLIQFNAQII